MARLQVQGIVTSWGTQTGLFIDNGGNIAINGVIEGPGPVPALSVADYAGVAVRGVILGTVRRAVFG